MFIFSQSPSPPIDELLNLGIAGLMGVMWLWERRTSRQREQQIDEAHARIMSDSVQLDQLMGVVRQNTEALTKLSTSHQQLVDQCRVRQMSTLTVRGETGCRGEFQRQTLGAADERG